MSNSMSGNQEWPRCGKQDRQVPGWEQDWPPCGIQDRQAPNWEINGTEHKDSMDENTMNPDMECHEDYEEWAQEQYDESQLDNLLDHQIMNEMKSARRMEESRDWGHTWPNDPFGTQREPEYRPHDLKVSQAQSL